MSKSKNSLWKKVKFHAREFQRSQIPVTTGGFELRLSCKQGKKLLSLLFNRDTVIYIACMMW